MDKNVNKSIYSPRHTTQMSENQLKRWCEARDTYLGDRPVIKRPIRIPKPPIITRVIKEECVPIVILKEHILDDKCVGTEYNETFIFDSDIEQIDEATQADFSTPESDKQQEIVIEQEIIEYNDKSTETDEICNQIEKEQESEPEQEIILESQSDPDPIVENEIDEKKTILSPSNSSTTSLTEQFHRLKHRFKRVSKERRLLSCLLFIYLFILIGLLIVIFMLLWGFADRPIVINREVLTSKSNLAPGVTQYGESCKIDNDCKRPFTCNKNSPSSSGTCRCPLKYAYVNNQCVGDLNAVCSKDIDCQRYMHCSGMNDGTRRCHCQNLYTYDDERKQCRGGYESLCENNLDCQINMICNRTLNISKCLCQVNYRYDSIVKKCRGEPGAICEQTTAECIDNAECRDGACECAFQFVPNDKKICVDPCPKILSKRVKIRFPNDCRRFIDCQQRSKHECPEPTIFNFRTQLCDYKKNVFDCR